MSELKFVPGKRYKSTYQPDGWFECVTGPDPEGWSCWRYQDGRLILGAPDGLGISTEEYKEPRKGTFWVNVYGNGLVGYPHTSREGADSAAESDPAPRIACVEVHWTEGEGLEGEKK